MGIYLDYNASTPIDERVLSAMVSAYRDFYGNADSRTHIYGQKANEKIAEAREQVASLLGVQSNEVIFTSGATESDNIAILGLEEYGNSVGRRHIITTSIEHKAVLEAARHLGTKDFSVELIDPESSGRINATTLLSKIRPDTLLVSTQHVNNETGIIQPVHEIGNALKNTNILFHVDAVQSCGKLVNEICTLHYDTLSLSAHKMHGPQGIGALIVRRKENERLPLQPIVFGGGQEGGLRPGTLPVALIVGLGRACQISQNEYQDNQMAYQQNKQNILDALKNAEIIYQINGDQSFCMDNTLNVSFLGIDSEALMIAAKHYCSISNGSACTSQDYSPSHVLTAMGLLEERIESAVRLSWGTTTIDIELVQQLLSIVQSQQI